MKKIFILIFICTLSQFIGCNAADEINDEPDYYVTICINDQTYTLNYGAINGDQSPYIETLGGYYTLYAADNLAYTETQIWAGTILSLYAEFRIDQNPAAIDNNQMHFTVNESLNDYYKSNPIDDNPVVITIINQTNSFMEGFFSGNMEHHSGIEYTVSGTFRVKKL